MTKKNKTLRIAVLVLALALITSCFVGTTFAKYTSTKTGADSAEVAIWDVQFKTGEDTTAATYEFNIFDTILDTANKNEETDVLAGKIAPGTYGSFSLTAVNKSEVTASVQLQLALADDSTAGLPIQYSIDGTTWGTLEALNTALEAQTLDLNNGTADEGTFTVYWQWAFKQTDVETGDAADTGFAVAGNKLSLEATFTAVQVD